MTLEEYMKQMNRIIKRHPEALKMIVVYSIDPEGNAFRPVGYHPMMGHFDGDNESWDTEGTPNSICLN